MFGLAGNFRSKIICLGWLGKSVPQLFLPFPLLPSPSPSNEAGWAYRSKLLRDKDFTDWANWTMKLSYRLRTFHRNRSNLFTDLITARKHEVWPHSSNRSVHHLTRWHYIRSMTSEQPSLVVYRHTPIASGNWLFCIQYCENPLLAGVYELPSKNAAKLLQLQLQPIEHQRRFAFLWPAR